MSDKAAIMESLKKAVETWDIKLAETAAKQALDAGIAPGDAVENGLGKGMETISNLFDEAKIFCLRFWRPPRPWRRLYPSSSP